MLDKNKILIGIFLMGLTMAAGLCFAQLDEIGEDQGTSIKDIKDKKFDLGIKQGETIQLQADEVSYGSLDNSATARGNVVASSGNAHIYADKVYLNRTTQEASASGQVYLETPNVRVDADQVTYNFADATGEFQNARLFNAPFQVKGTRLIKDSDTHLQMQDGFMTTCDHDKPHFRMRTRRADVFMGDRFVARGVTMYLGNVPVMYLPGFTQKIGEEPWFTFEPGYKKDLGYYLLTRSRIKVNDHWTSTLRIDGYERQGFAWGTENKYNTTNYGAGLVRTYFINERSIAAKHPWQRKTAPTVQNERYQVEWRHRWQVDPKTNVMWQYYRLSDDQILRRYFRKEFQRDSNVDTYFLLTRSMPVGTLGFRVDHRVNRFVSAVDRTPEITYNASGVPVGSTGFNLKTTNSFSNLVSRAASPTEDRKKTLRVDTDNEISYPFKVGFVHATPMVGEDLTFYSRAIDPADNNVLRTTFKTGMDLSTRFFKVVNVPKGLFGKDISRIRHIVSPLISYRYQHKPSLAASRLNQFDTAIDGLDKQHYIDFSLENKLQAKRGKEIVDLIRDVLSTRYTIHQKGVKGQLGNIDNLLEIVPADWVRMTSELSYDHKKNRFSEHNFDVYFTSKDKKLGLDIGDRYARGYAHELTTQVAYIINPKWRVRMLDRYELGSGKLIDERYTITRDLHEWEVDLIYDQSRGNGREILVVFRLKAFPGQGLDLFSTAFHQRKTGSTP